MGGSEISKCLRMLTVVADSEFGLTLTQNNPNFYNLDTELYNLQLEVEIYKIFTTNNILLGFEQVIQKHNCILKR